MSKIIQTLLDEAAKLPEPVKEDAKPKKLREWVENPSFDKLWEKYVPAQGEAKTMFGEAVRALGRLEYDYYNNGFGNAYDWKEDDSNYYGDDEEPDGIWEADDYYGDLGRHLVKFLKNRSAHADVIAAATFVAPGPQGAKPWYTGKPDPKFKRSVELLKNWFVENEKEHA
jgi:hypothetical protein